MSEGLASSAKIEAEKHPSSVNFNLNPQDSGILKGLAIGESMTVLVKGTVRSVSMADYGSSVGMDVDMIGVKPKPEKESFVEEMDEIRVSAAK